MHPRGEKNRWALAFGLKEEDIGHNVFVDREKEKKTALCGKKMLPSMYQVQPVNSRVTHPPNKNLPILRASVRNSWSPTATDKVVLRDSCNSTV